MPRRVPLLALPLGFVVALAIAACGSSGSKDSATTLPPLSATTQASTPATIETTTVTTATQPNTVTTSRTTTTLPTTTRPSGGAAPPGAATGGAPAACPSAVGGFIRDMHATDCGVARTVANAWFAAVHGGTRPDSPIQADGYSCTGTLAGEQASVSCTAAGGGSVAFTASP